MGASWWDDGNGVESGFVPLFALEYNSFEEEYATQVDVAHALWHGFMQVCASLLTRQICWQALPQGLTFCLKGPPPQCNLTDGSGSAFRNFGCNRIMA